MTEEPFEDFAARYDLMAEDPSPRREFFRTLIGKHGIKTTLDCACGTGSDLVLLSALGVETIGADVSAAMLEQARQRLAAAGADINLHRLDFRDLSKHFDRRFDCVLCLGTSLPQLLDESDILAALRSMRSMLAESGVLIISQGMTDRQLARKPRFVPIVNRPDHSRIMVIDYYEIEWEVHVLDLIRTDSRPRFEVDSFRYRLLLRDDYQRLLRDADFSGAEFMGGWDGQPYDKSSSGRLIVVAHR